jgi:hypothetical protein
MIRLGVSLPALMRLLGHKDIRMTMRYVQVTQCDLQRELHLARQNAAQHHQLPELSVSSRLLASSDLPGIRRALAATRHLLEMYRRQLQDEKARRKLQRLEREPKLDGSERERLEKVVGARAGNLGLRNSSVDLSARGAFAWSRNSRLIIIPDMCGRYCLHSVGVARGRKGALVSAAKPQSSTGARCNGQPLKKSPKRKAHDRLPRRERNNPTTPPVPHVGTQGSDTDSAVQLHLGLAVGYRRTDLVELLLPVL